MGFDAFFFSRLDYQDLENRQNTQELEWIWRPNNNTLGKDVQIMTHATQTIYYAPRDFGWEIDWTDTEWVNNVTDPNFNGPERAAKLMAILNERATHFRHNHLFAVWGGDFMYKEAEKNYRNMDHMIEYMNANFGDKYHFQYSTPSNYVDAINALNISWPAKYDDMFPYSDNPDGYWTGYFTSRPNHKSYIKTASHKYHASAQLFAEKLLDQSISANQTADILNANYQMLDRIGIAQHHDAVTGTAKQRVADDYSAKLYTGLEINHVQYQKLINERIQKQTGWSGEYWH